MSHSHADYPFKLDPWAASSLLQKAIRRGEVELAQHAAAILYQQRGSAIWSRMIVIAVEDVGIADPQLLWEVTRLATDKKLRASNGPEVDQIMALCAKLAAAPKDRSADYVFCAAMQLPTALQDRTDFDRLSFEEKLSIAENVFEPTPRRAVAALSACTLDKGDRLVMDQRAAEKFVRQFNLPNALVNSMTALTSRSGHPFCLTLPLIWSLYDFTGRASGYSKHPLPYTECLSGIPLYTFDKHTAVGKRAISKLPQHSAAVRDILTRWVPEERWADVILMAAFYADAAPVAHRLNWFAGELLEYTGVQADMTFVGCPFEAVTPILGCVRNNLAKINELRRSILLRR